MLPKSGSIELPNDYILLGNRDRGTIIYLKKDDQKFILMGYSYLSQEGYDIISGLDLIQSIDFFKEIKIRIKCES
jgi:hypothetical protein